MIAAHEVDLTAMDPLAVGAGRLDRCEGEISEDPEGVVPADTGVDRLEEGLVMTNHGFGGNFPVSLGIDGGAGRLLIREKGTLAIADDVGVAEMEIGGEPEFGHGDREERERRAGYGFAKDLVKIQSEKSMEEKRKNRKSAKTRRWRCKARPGAF